MPIILNKEELATNELRKNALEILEAGLEAINTKRILNKKLRVENGFLHINGEEVIKLPLKNETGRVIFVGIGKCALDGARAIENILGEYLDIGAVIDVKGASEALDLIKQGKIKYFQGTHPLPSEQNVEATMEILEMTKGLTDNDLVIALISGGGSALFEFPSVPLEMVIQTTKDFMTKGADIYELNQIRKQMSQVKGGKFAEHCFPATVVSLIFSDVLGNDISVVASGPTVLSKINEKVKNILICSNRDALVVMKDKAVGFGFDATIETEKFSGDASEMGKNLALKHLESKTCLLLGGETTVKIRGRGFGGRNQEMALSALPHLKPNSVLICAASDGWDNSEYDGAIVDLELFQKAKNLNLDPEEYLVRNDSYNFFKNIGDGAILTGKLESNVSDLVIIANDAG